MWEPRVSAPGGGEAPRKVLRCLRSALAEARDGRRRPGPAAPRWFAFGWEVGEDGSAVKSNVLKHR